MFHKTNYQKIVIPNSDPLNFDPWDLLLDQLNLARDNYCAANDITYNTIQQQGEEKVREFEDRVANELERRIQTPPPITQEIVDDSDILPPPTLQRQTNDRQDDSETDADELPRFSPPLTQDNPRSLREEAWMRACTHIFVAKLLYGGLRAINANERVIPILEILQATRDHYQTLAEQKNNNQTLPPPSAA